MISKTNYLHAVDEHSHRLFLLALSYTHNRFDAEDICQNVFLKLWKNKKDFQDDEHLSKWLTIVCINECKNFNKKSARRVALDEHIQIADSNSIGKNEQAEVLSAIMQLSDKENIVIHLYYYEEMTVAEIAKVLKISESAAKQRLARGRQHLKELLEDI